LARLQTSAAALGFKFEASQAIRALQDHTRALGDGGTHRVRLDLHHDGMVTVKSAPLEPLPDQPVSLLMAPNPVPTQERSLLAHKTSLRSTYDAAIQAATRQGAFDALFVNPQGMLTEGGRSSVFVKLNGRWYTPSLESGVLPGVMRARVLALSPGMIEREIHSDELAHAQALAVCNALRGVLRAVLQPA
jgi:para-aminobenzoate synthetase/4-amino-4-deoxychorismate lyase